MSKDEFLRFTLGKKAKPESGDASSEPPPAPIAKAARASLTHSGAAGRTVNAGDDIFPWPGEQVRRRDPSGPKPVVVVMDGRKCLWSDAQAALGERRRVEILAWVHGNEKLRQITRRLDPPSERRLAMASYVETVLEGTMAEN